MASVTISTDSILRVLCGTFNFPVHVCKQLVFFSCANSLSLTRADWPQRREEVARAYLYICVLFSQVSLWLSRACLGKRIVYIPVINCSKDDEAREVQRTAHSARRTTATSLPLPASKTPQAMNQGMRHRGSLRTKARGIRWWMWMAAIECMWIRLDESHTPKPQTIIGTRSVFTACTAQDAVFLSTFSYGCPEPVLVNRSFLAYKWLQEGVFLAFFAPSRSEKPRHGATRPW